MVPKSFMLVAGEPSGDLLGAELVTALRARLTANPSWPGDDYQPRHTSLAPTFFGAGGPAMERAGVQLSVDMTQHAVVGLWEVLKKYRQFRRLFQQLLKQAFRELPDVLICIDFSGFNLRFARAVRAQVRNSAGAFGNWRPRIVQYVSPQVWASRARRAESLARDFDLLLSVIPFERDWYAAHQPQLAVEFVGHPLVDRLAGADLANRKADSQSQTSAPLLLLLPGSRVGELRRHLPAMLEAFRRVKASAPELDGVMVLPSEQLLTLARTFGLPDTLRVVVGNLPNYLARADIALASTGTVTLECAFYGVPTVALYRTSWTTYQIAKHLVQVKHLAMPNLLARETVFPEFIQNAASPENLSRAVLDLWRNPGERLRIRERLANVVQTLGTAGASDRAAAAVLALLGNSQPRI